MKLIVDTTSGSLFSTKHGPSFSIDVHYMDTVLMLKQRIEKSQGIPVFKQTLFLQGKVLQDDHYYLQNLLPYYSSRLLLSISPEDNPNQNNNDQVPQTEQSPSNPVLEFANNQGWPVMSNNDQVLKIEEPPMTLKSKKEFFRIQDPTRRINSGSYSLELLGPLDSPPVTVGNKRNRYQTEQSPKKWMVVFVSSPYCGDIMRVRVKAADAVKNLRNELVQLTQDGYFFTHNKHVLNEDLSYEWNGVKDSDTVEISKIQDTPVTVWSSNQNHQTEKSSQSDSVKEMKTSPTDLTVYVQPFEECSMIFPVKVNANDNVEELRKELVNMEEKGVLYVPHKRYQFVLRDETLTETKSFTWNLVGDGDTIVIIRKSSLKSPFSLF